jgi:hypothetical protein
MQPSASVHTLWVAVSIDGSAFLVGRCGSTGQRCAMHRALRTAMKCCAEVPCCAAYSLTTDVVATVLRDLAGWLRLLPHWRPYSCADRAGLRRSCAGQCWWCSSMWYR